MQSAWRFCVKPVLFLIGPILGPILTGLLPAVLAEPRHFSMLDFWQQKCDAGDTRACVRLQGSRADVDKLARLDQRAEEYGRRIDQDAMLGSDGKPKLAAAYRQVIREFIVAEHALGNDELSYDEMTVAYCADHYHHYWTNQKLWWPTDENGKPDWIGIYFYVIDHYYGVCLRRYFN